MDALSVAVKGVAEISRRVGRPWPSILVVNWRYGVWHEYRHVGPLVQVSAQWSSGAIFGDRLALIGASA